MRFWGVRYAKRAAGYWTLSGLPVILGHMGRPSLGAAGRTVRANTKISANEERALVARFGTVHKGLRAALDAYLGVQAGPKSKIEHIVATQDTLGQPACRVHRSYREVRRYFEQGTEYVEKECADCGTRTTRRVMS